MSTVLFVTLLEPTYARSDLGKRHAQQFGPNPALRRAALPGSRHASASSEDIRPPGFSSHEQLSNPKPEKRVRSAFSSFRIPLIALVRRKLLSSCSNTGNGRPRAPRTHPSGLPCPGGGEPSSCSDGCRVQSLGGAALPGRHDGTERDGVECGRAFRSVRCVSALALKIATHAMTESDCACRAGARGPSNRRGGTPMRKMPRRDTTWCARVHESRRTGGAAR